jgi:hypothetical protein
MEIILLVVIAVVFLVGLVAFAVGRQGWNWGTIIAGILVLLASLGFTFLAGMVGQQERAWREIIATYQKKIAKERDGLGAGGEGGGLAEKSIASLEQEKARWQRVWNLVDEWGGRSWPNASFIAPTDGRAGTITVEDVEKLTIVTGAEVYVFDDGDIAEGGAFLGAFHVDAIDPTKPNTLTISPAAPPTEEDRKLWAKPREAITVYETLPNDTWLAFHTLSPKKGAAAENDDESVLPMPRVTDREALLKHLEARLKEVSEHAQVVPEDELPAVLEKVKQGSVTPGRYWAKVVFKKPKSFPIDGREPAQFESGQTGEFDLETAQKLKEEGDVDIVAVESRRPLVDPLMAIRGGEHAGDATVQTEGLSFMRRMLEGDIVDILAMTERLKQAKTTTQSQLAIHKKEADDLGDDLRNWEADARAAEQTATKFERRVAELGTELSGLETAIVELGRELAGASALLAGEIDAATPPPGRAVAQPARAAERIP